MSRCRSASCALVDRDRARRRRSRRARPRARRRRCARPRRCATRSRRSRSRLAVEELALERPVSAGRRARPSRGPPRAGRRGRARRRRGPTRATRGRAGLRLRWTLRPSRSSSIQPRRRGHSRSSASCASSTVPSLIVSSRRSASRSSTGLGVGADELVERHAAALDRSRPRRPRPAAAARGGRAARCGVVELAECLLGEPRDRAAHAAGVARTRRGAGAARRGAATARAAPSRAAAARPARPRRRRRALDELGLDAQADALRGALDRARELVAAASARRARGWRRAGARAPGTRRSGRRSRRGARARRRRRRLARRAAAMNGGALVLVAAGRERLLELVDGEHEAAAADAVDRLVAAAAADARRAGCTRCGQRSLPGSTPLASAGSRPARTTEDLPLPDGPTTPSSGAPTSRATSSATSRSRPKKYGASAASNDARPLNGHTTGASPSPRLAPLARGLELDDAAGELGLHRAQPARPAAPRRPPATRSRRLRRAHWLATSCTRRGTPPLAPSSHSRGGRRPPASGDVAGGDRAHRGRPRRSRSRTSTTPGRVRRAPRRRSRWRARARAAGRSRTARQQLGRRRSASSTTTSSGRRALAAPGEHVVDRARGSGAGRVEHARHRAVDLDGQLGREAALADPVRAGERDEPRRARAAPRPSASRSHAELGSRPTSGGAVAASSSCGSSPRRREIERGSWRRIASCSGASSGPGSTPSSSASRSPRLAVGLERLGLAPAAVEREHQLAGEPLARRVLGDEPPQLADDLGVAAGGEVGLDAQLERGQPLLLEPRDLGLRERLERQVGERRPAPQRERLAQQPRRWSALARRPARAGRPRRAARSARRRARPAARAGGSRPASSSTTSPSPSALRSRETCTCTVLTAPAGASSPHSASASRSALTGSFGVEQEHGEHRARLPAAHRSRRGRSCTSSGPRILNSTLHCDATPVRDPVGKSS